jgi:hypothetical protein
MLLSGREKLSSSEREVARLRQGSRPRWLCVPVMGEQALLLRPFTEESRCERSGANQAAASPGRTDEW